MALFTEDELHGLYVQQRLSLRAIAEQKGCHKDTVRHYLILYGIPRRSVSEAKMRYPRKNFSGELTEKAYLLGFRAGDLHVHAANYSETSHTIIVACGSTVPEQIDLIRSLFEDYGHVGVSQKAKQAVITCYLDLSFSFLLGKEDRIPDWVLADQKSFAAYLAGYIDAEGCIQVKRHTDAAEVIIRSYDVNILQTCWVELKKLGVACPVVSLTQRKGERNARGSIYHGDYWRLGIYRKESVLRLFTIISPYLKHAKRCRDMLAALENVRTRLESV